MGKTSSKNGLIDIYYWDSRASDPYEGQTDYAVTLEGGIGAGIKIQDIPPTMLDDDLLIEGIYEDMRDDGVLGNPDEMDEKIDRDSRGKLTALVPFLIANASSPDVACRNTRSPIWFFYSEQWKEDDTVQSLADSMGAFALAMAVGVRAVARNLNLSDDHGFRSEGNVEPVTYREPLVGFRPQLLQFAMQAVFYHQESLGLITGEPSTEQTAEGKGTSKHTVDAKRKAKRKASKAGRKNARR